MRYPHLKLIAHCPFSQTSTYPSGLRRLNRFDQKDRLMPTAITVVCPHCNNRMQASSEYVGRKGRCPACKALVKITASSGDESAASHHQAQASGVPRGGAARLGATNVSGWKSGIAGAVAMAGAYLLVFLLARNTFLGNLFLDRGPMPYFITLMTCWGIAILVMKYVAVKKQVGYAELELELIPLEIGVQITPDNVDQFLGHLGNLPYTQRQSILGRRIHGALEHFKSRTSVPEVQEYVSTQAEIDASSVDSGYSLLRAFIWAVPILGFIGTVLGISDAVSGLNTSISGGDGEQLMEGLGIVTHGLASAFDTTFIALAMAILLLFPTETLRKIEYGMLDRIEQFTNESLLRRMADQQGRLNTEELPEIVRDVLVSAFQEHQRWLAEWQAQVAALGELIGADFEATVLRIEHQVAENQSARSEQLKQLSGWLDEVFGRIDQATASWHPEDKDGETPTASLFDTFSQLKDGLRENSELHREMLQQQSPEPSAHNLGDLTTNLLQLTQQIDKLSERMGPDSQSTLAPESEPLDSVEPVAEPPPLRQRGGISRRPQD